MAREDITLDFGPNNSMEKEIEEEIGEEKEGALEREALPYL